MLLAFLLRRCPYTMTFTSETRARLLAQSAEGGVLVCRPSPRKPVEMVSLSAVVGSPNLQLQDGSEGLAAAWGDRVRAYGSRPGCGSPRARRMCAAMRRPRSPSRTTPPAGIFLAVAPSAGLSPCARNRGMAEDVRRVVPRVSDPQRRRDDHVLKRLARRESMEANRDNFTSALCAWVGHAHGVIGRPPAVSPWRR